ncbi:MAG: hypothetical protein ACOCRA_03750 [Halobacteria archaeon]
MGENAERVQERLAAGLAERIPDAEWVTEYGVGGTPVDIGGTTGVGELYLVELEWRRADPADNAAKIFRHATKTMERQTYVFQVFTRYYELADGGVSSKRKNAEFVGETAAETLEGLSYTAVSLDAQPPKRGGELPDGWRSEVEAVAEEIERGLRE